MYSSHSRRRHTDQRNPVVAGDRQHVAVLAGFQLGAQPGVGAVDLVTGDLGRRDPGVQRVGDHGCGQLRLGRKPRPRQGRRRPGSASGSSVQNRAGRRGVIADRIFIPHQRECEIRGKLRKLRHKLAILGGAGPR